MELSPGAAGYRVANPPMLLTSALEAGLDVCWFLINTVPATVLVALCAQYGDAKCDTIRYIYVRSTADEMASLV